MPVELAAQDLTHECVDTCLVGQSTEFQHLRQF